MVKKCVIVVSVLMFLTFISCVYLNRPYDSVDSPSDKGIVVFKDSKNHLIPITIDMLNTDSFLQTIYNKIDFMKSDQWVNDGLIPVLDESFEILSLSVENQHIDMHIYTSLSHDCYLELIESLNCLIKDVIDLYTLDVYFYSQSDLKSPLIHSYHGLNKELGMNNFIDYSLYLHDSQSVEIYKEIQINKRLYMYPQTYRVNTHQGLYETVNFTLNKIDQSIILKDVYEDGYGLTIEIEGKVLNDNEKMNLNIENMIILSLRSIDDYQYIRILSNGENVRNHSDINITINYFKIT